MRRIPCSWLRWGLSVSLISVVAVLPSARVSHAAAAPITLTFAVPAGSIEQIGHIVINAYTKLHPNVKITLEPVSGDFSQKMFIEAAARTLPDVLFSADALNAPFTAHHIALNLQPYINKDPAYNIGDIYQNFLNLGRLSGYPGLYMLPLSADAIVTFYNKDMFKAAGVPYPQPNWTYAQFLDAAQKLTKTDRSGKVTQWGVELSNWWAIDVPWLVGFGGSLLTSDGKHYNLSSPGSIAGFQAIQDLYTKYKVAVPPTVQLPADPFVAGKSAMAFFVHAGVPQWVPAIGKKFTWDVQEMPSFPSGRHVNGMGAAGFAVSTNSRQRAAAVDFVKFISSVAGQRALGPTGTVTPVRKSMIKDPSWLNYPLNNAAFIKAIQYGMTPPQLPTDAALNCGTVNSGIAQTAFNTAFDKISRGQPVAATLQAADQTINQCIDSLGN